MTPKYKIVGESIVETATGHAKVTLTLPKWEASLNFTCKVMNGELVPKWEGDTVIFLPAKRIEQPVEVVPTCKGCGEERGHCVCYGAGEDF